MRNLAQELLAFTIESGGAEACEDWEKVALLNTKFHQGIFEIPDNSHIAHLGKHINVQMLMIMLANGDSPEVYKPTVIRNAAIANAPLEGDKIQVIELVEKFLTDSHAAFDRLDSTGE